MQSPSLQLVLLFFFFFFFFCNGENSDWHLNHSFIVNSSSPSYYSYITSSMPKFHFFPVDLNVSYANADIMDDVYAFLCFISPPSQRSYILSICMDAFVSPGDFNDSNPTVVWSANRGKPARGENVSLTLDNKGNLLLRGDNDDDEPPYWASNTANKGVVRMEFSHQFPVNLILFDSNNKILWQSIDYPTDTLTFNQSLKQGMKLVSWASSTDPSEGNFSFVLEHGGMALYSSITTPQPYWTFGFCSDNSLQSIKNSSCGIYMMSFIGCGYDIQGYYTGSFDYGLCYNTNVSLLRLEWNGNLRMFAITAHTYFPTWSLVHDTFVGPMICGLPMHCGPYGVCRGEGQCSCPIPTSGSSTLFSELNNNTQSWGLAQSLQISCPLHSNNTATNASLNWQMLEFQGLDYFSNTFTSPLLSLRTEERCKDECLHNCSCLAAFWHNHSQDCFHVDQMGGLLGSYVDPDAEKTSDLNSSYRAFLKVDSATSSRPRQKPLKVDGATNSSARRKPIRNYVIGLVSGLGTIFLLSSLFYFMNRKLGVSFFERGEEEAIMHAIPGLPTRFSYKDLHSATNGFTDKLGQGGFGAVYAGTLISNNIATKVAVKQLEGLRQGDKEFRSEVAIMGRIHHFNLLRLLGFCAQGSHRLVVYEYMENGSLDQWLFKRHQDTKKAPLPWDVRYRIAVGAARGVAYLHEDCRERILHLDIKPQNILLDDNFVAKVADFGLSRLMERDKSHVITTIRGTPGYLAPDWLKEGSIDEKCDVFSFGMLLLEIISGRKNLDHTMESQEQTYYPEWAFWQAQKDNDICELTDAKVESEDERIEVRRMLKTAFLCLLENPALRPSMEKVVQMLEGHVLVSHIHLSTLHQGLLFVLRNPSTFAQTDIEGENVNNLASSSTSRPVTNIASCSGGKVSSFYISTR